MFRGSFFIKASFLFPILANEHSQRCAVRFCEFLNEVVLFNRTTAFCHVGTSNIVRLRQDNSSQILNLS
jgi:hypothetical protein